MLMSRPCNNNTMFIVLAFFPYIVLLVLVVAHDGDDGVVDEQSQGQNSQQGNSFSEESKKQMKKNSPVRLGNVDLTSGMNSAEVGSEKLTFIPHSQQRKSTEERINMMETVPDQNNFKFNICYTTFVTFTQRIELGEESSRF